MIELSERLRMIASLVPKCEIIADVGTDHGYLAAWLLQNQIASHVFATDIHSGPLARAKQTASEYGLNEKMELHLCDGLQFPNASDAQAVILAGMGGETMISILQAASWTLHNTVLILQPQSKLSMLCAWLHDQGVELQEAKLCLDAGKRYLAFRAQGADQAETSVEELLFRGHDPMFPDYLDSEEQRLRFALDGMRAASRDMKQDTDALMKRLEIINYYQKAVKTW